MKEIKFLAYYNTPDNAEKHNLSPAASNKVGYVVTALGKLQKYVSVISASRPAALTGNPAITKRIDDYARLLLLPELKGGNWFTNKVSTLAYYYNLHRCLLQNFHREDVVIVYHSLKYMDLVQRLKEKIGFRLILEVEEIYGDVQQSQEIVDKELHFFQSADGFIFPTEQLNKRINSEEKPYVIAHGAYQAEPELENTGFFDEQEGRVHVVYAGTFDPRKGGALAAISAAEFLPGNYHMHILGFGTDEEVEKVVELVAKTDHKIEGRITYDGCLSGEDYRRFIQSCDVGLSTQNPAAAFNDSSFPSKILSYMANGLRVVSIRIPVVETSNIGDLVSYYDVQTPEQIAKAIMNIDLSVKCDSRERIVELDAAFQKDLLQLLDQV